MGTTPLDGLVMGTRCGSLDADVMPDLMRERGMTAEAVEHLLYHEAGLPGLSGVSADMRAPHASEAPAAAVQTWVMATAAEQLAGIVGRVDRISAIATSIASAVEQQGAATAEISRTVQQMAASTERVALSMASVSRAANDTGEAASLVLGSAGGLSRQAEQRTGKVSSFVTSVRSA
jgi:hypothetical protein